jgi:P4 family phage/plasmid primase-like protien
MNVPSKHQDKHIKLTMALEEARQQLESYQKQLDGMPNNLRLQQGRDSVALKVKKAENALNHLNFKIEREAEEAQQAIAKQEEAARVAIMAWEEVLGPGELAETISRRGEPVYYTERGPVLNDAFLGTALLRQRTVLFSPSYNDFFEYSPQTGLWFPVTKEKLTDQLHELLVNMDQKVYRGSIGICSTKRFRNYAVDSQKGALEDKKAFTEFDRRVAQVSNGVVTFDKDEIALNPFSPHYRSLYASPVAYDATAECPKFLELIAHLKEEDRCVIQRAAGQMLIGRNLTQKIFIFEGVANSGKSTIAEIMLEVIGRRAVTELRTEHLNGRFELFKAHNKSLLLGADVAHDFLQQEGAAYLKKLVGGDYLDAEKKNSNEQFNFQGNLNILLVTNCKLVIRLYSDAAAWERRLVIIDFPSSNRAPEQNIPEYAKKLIAEEGPGILRWMLQGAQQLLKAIADQKGFILTADQKKRVTDRIAESDSLPVFLKERINATELPNATISTDEIVREYASFCFERGWGNPAHQVIERHLSELLPRMYNAQRTNKILKDSRFIRGYSGIIWNFSTADQDDQARTSTPRSDIGVMVQRALNKFGARGGPISN